MFAFIEFGRVGVQPLVQLLINRGLQHTWNPRLLLTQCWVTARRDKLFAAAAGGIVGLGYFLFMLGSDRASPTAAFAIANCSPLVAILLGACHGEVRHYSAKGRATAVASFLFYAAAVALLAQAL